MVQLSPKLPTERMTKNPLELPSPLAAGTLPKTYDNKEEQEIALGSSCMN
jgi:hypothetical protein